MRGGGFPEGGGGEPGGSLRGIFGGGGEFIINIFFQSQKIPTKHSDTGTSHLKPPFGGAAAAFQRR